MCPPFSIFRKILHFQPCFGQNFSSQDANRSQDPIFFKENPLPRPYFWKPTKKKVDCLPQPGPPPWMHSGMQILQTTLSKSLYNFMKRFRIADHFDPVIIQCYKGSILKACNIWKEIWNFADNFDYDHTIIKVVGKSLHFFWSLIRFTFAKFCQIFTHRYI